MSAIIVSIQQCPGGTKQWNIYWKSYKNWEKKDNIDYMPWKLSPNY